MDSRFSVLYQYINGKWRIVHIHQSMPNPEQEEGESYPKRLLDLYYDEKEKVEELRNLAENDALTGLMNYKTFRKIFDESLGNMCLIAIDIDNFKTINDTYGHPEGNHILQAVAKALKSSVGSDDMVCRMGGDEFLILCREVDSSQAIGRLLDKIKEEIGEIGKNQGYRISVSMGAASVGNRESFDMVFKRADEALYQAKKHGKNKWEVSVFS